jgi:hypothetical protein
MPKCEQKYKFIITVSMLDVIAITEKNEIHAKYSRL